MRLNKVYLVFIFVCFLGGWVNAFAQVNAYEGKHFWVTFSRPTNLFNPVNNTITLLSRTNTTVTVQNLAKGYTTTVSLTANTIKDVSVPFNISTTDTVEVVKNYGMEIIAPVNISVQLIATNNQGDGTMVFPVDKLGTEYYCMSYDGATGFQAGRSTMSVLATQNNTLVEITPGSTTSGQKAGGTPFTVTLNEGQSYCIEGNGTNDMTGTYVRVVNGCKPVVVFSGSECSNVPASCSNCGHLYEVMPHVDTWGKSFLIAPLVNTGFQAPRYTYRILAITNGTSVTINGNTSTLNKGDIKEVNNVSNSSSVCLKSSQPILVAQFTEGWGCQSGSVPRMMFITPTEQMVKNAVVVCNIPTTAGNSHTLMVITKTTARSRLKLNGSVITVSNYSTFSDCQEWSYVNVAVNRGPHSIVSDSGFAVYAYDADFSLPYLVNTTSAMHILRYDVGVANQICGGLNATLYNTGDSAFITNSYWIFDDLSTKNGKQVSKSYSAHGVYPVTNIVTFQQTCPYVDTIQGAVRTLPFPVAGVSVNNTDQCLFGNSFIFSDTSRFPPNSKRKAGVWSFSDTSTTYKSIFTVTRSFSKPGTVKVKLVVESTDGCMDSTEKTIKINANPKPDYQVASPQCFKSHVFNPVQLTTVQGGSVGSYYWDFGDGTYSTQATPAKKFSLDSTYLITFVPRSTAGCDDTLRRYFTIYPSPTASFTASGVCMNDTMKAFNASNSQVWPLSYEWKFGDGNTDTNTNVVRRYNDTGTYRVVLTATNTYNCPDSFIVPVPIYPAPKPAFTYIKACTKNPTRFINSTFAYGITPVQYLWDLGEKDSFTTFNITYPYKKEGAYTIRLYAKLLNGCMDSVKQNIYINPNPNVSFSINDSLQCIRGNSFSFFNATTLSEGKIKEFTWKLNDTLWNKNISNTKTFDKHGTFGVKLVAVTDSLCADSTGKTFEVAPQTTINLSSPKDTQCFKNHAFTLVNSSTVPTGTVSYQWKYSNGDVDTATHPIPKKFKTPGRFQLTLVTVTDKDCRDSILREFTLYPSPEIDFQVNDVCGSDSARFLNFSKVSSGRVVTWIWDLGDGDSSFDKRPVHKYPNFGPFSATLIGITDLGCPDTLKQDTALTIKPAPASQFNTILVQQRGNETEYDFINQSTGADNYFWNFDRGQTSREANPRFVFRDTGKYHIIYTVSNKEGCFSSSDTTIFVVPDIDILIPNAFSPNKDVMNPVFRIEGSYFYREFEMQIFDRWGQQVFRTTDPEKGWDGSFDGRMMPDGVYIYYIRIIGTDTKVRNYKGNLHLLR